MPFTIVTQGSFTSTGIPVNIPLPSSADYFKTINYTQMNLTGTVCVGGEWFNGVTAINDGIRWKKAGSNVINMDLFSTATASNGFTYITEPTLTLNPNLITGITAANPAVVTQTNTYSNGDIVFITNSTGELQIGGLAFQVSSVSGSGYTLLGLPNTVANGFSAATSGKTKKSNVIFDLVEPGVSFITNISQATQAVVSLNVDPANYYVVGMKMKFTVPSSFGMKEMDGLTGTIVAIDVAATTNTAAYNIVVDIDSSSFTAFTFPASSTSPTSTLFAQIAPAGTKTAFDPVTLVQTGYNFTKDPFRTGNFTPSMYLGAGANSPAGANGDVIIWQAYKMET